MQRRQLIQELEADGWVLGRITGSHHIFKHPQKPVSIPVPHPKKTCPLAQSKASANGLACQRNRPPQEKTMYYPVFIEYGNDTTAFGMQVPDIPGAVTAGDTFEQAWQAAIEVGHLMLQEIADQGQAIPLPTAVSAHQGNPDLAGMGVALLDIDVTPYLGTTEKINVTLPAYLIRRIDDYVRDHRIKSRSAFLTEAALATLQ